MTKARHTLRYIREDAETQPACELRKLALAFRPKQGCAVVQLMKGGTFNSSPSISSHNSALRILSRVSSLPY